MNEIEQKIKFLAELVLLQGEILDEVILAQNKLREDVMPLLPQEDGTINMLHRIEKIEALCATAANARGEAKRVFELDADQLGGENTPPA